MGKSALDSKCFTDFFFCITEKSINQRGTNMMHMNTKAHICALTQEHVLHITNIALHRSRYSNKNNKETRCHFESFDRADVNVPSKLRSHQYPFPTTGREYFEFHHAFITRHHFSVPSEAPLHPAVYIWHTVPIIATGSLHCQVFQQATGIR